MQRLGLLALVLAGCPQGNTPDACELASSDVRVDKVSAGDDPDEVESGNTLMCVNDKGEISVAWIDSRDGKPAIWFNSSKDGGVTWLPQDVRVNQGDGNVEEPSIGCSATAVYVAWEDDRDGELGYHNIYMNHSADLGKTWQETDTALDNDPEGRSYSQAPYVAVAGTAVYVAWFDNVLGAYDIYINGSADEGATWGSPVRVDADGAGDAYSAYPQVVARDDGVVMVVWEDARSGKNDIYFARSDNGAGSFGGSDIRIDGGDDPGSHNSFAPRMAIDGDNVYVVWHDKRNAATDEGAGDIYANYSSDGGRDWAPVAAIVEDPTDNQPGFYYSRFPVVAVKANKAVVAWEDNRNEGYDIYERNLEAGQPVGPETRLDVGNETSPTEPGQDNSFETHIAASGSNVVVVWSDQRDVTNTDDGFSDLYYNFSKDFGATWSDVDLRVDNIEAGAAFKQDINVALVGDTFYTTWTDGRTGSADIYEHTLKVGDESDYVVVGDNADQCIREEPTSGS